MTFENQSNNHRSLKQGRLPNLVIIGAMKCGTSSLHNYLDLHPQIKMSTIKELDFFVSEKNWSKGIAWYRSHFQDDADIVGESSPNYTKYPTFSGVPERMYRTIPEAKLIYLIRDPIERIVSHYMHQYTARAESRSLSMALSDLSNNHYIYTSCYEFQVTQFLKFYHQSQILTVKLEALKENRLQTLKQIFKFLEVDDVFEHPDFFKTFHQSHQKRRLTDWGARLYGLPFGGRLAALLPAFTTETVEKPTVTDDIYLRLKDIFQGSLHHLRP